MSDFAKMDIFFVIATLALVMVTVLICVLLIYAIRIARYLHKMSGLVAQEGELIKEDIDLVREDIRRKGLEFGHIARRIMEFPKKRRTRAKKTIT
jgi:phage terminase Nu1 subunit (DNA packaging protein)